MTTQFFLPLADVGQGIKPSSGAQLFFFASDGVTPKDTFTDQEGLIPHSNPVISDANGVFAQIWLEGEYEVTLKDKNDVQIWEADNVGTEGDQLSVTKQSIVTVTGQLLYAIPGNASDQGTVNINGRMLQETNGDYVWVKNGDVFDLLLTTAVFDTEDMEVTNRSIVAPPAASSTLGQNLTFIADVATTDLNLVDNFATDNFDIVGDNGGAEWSYTGTTNPSKAGSPPDLDTGNVYDLLGRIYVYSKTVLFDRAFGIKSSDAGLNIHIDVTQQLNDFVAFGRLRAAQDGLAKGGSNLFFTPRQELEKTGTLNLIDYYIKINFNNTRIIQQDSTNDIINWEANNAGFEFVELLWDPAITAEDFFNNEPAAIRLSGSQPNAITSESVFSKLNNVWIRGGFDGIRLKSLAPDGGLFWQFIFSQVYIRDHLNQAFRVDSVAQVSTTSTFENCHLGLKVRSGVTNGGQSYLALQHMEASAPVQPGVTSGWEDFWEQESVPVLTREAWQSGVFYRTMGKGWFINNIQTVEMKNCSIDGGTNEQPGNLINCVNSVLTVSGLHLEGHNLSKADGVSFLIGSDLNFGFLYMFDLRLRPGAGNKAYLFGGVAGRNRNFTLEGVRNQNQATITSGELIYVNGGNDVNAFNALSVGSGVPEHLTFNVPDETSFVRNIRSITITGTGTVGDQTYDNGLKTVVVASAANPDYTVQREDSSSERGGYLHSDATGVFTITMDRTITPIGDSIKFINRGSGSSALLANGTGTIIGPTTAATTKALTVTRLTDTIFVSEVSA